MSDKMHRTIALCEVAREEIEREFNRLAPKEVWWPHRNSRGEIEGLAWGWGLCNGWLSYTADVQGHDKRLEGKDYLFRQALIRAVNAALLREAARIQESHKR